MKRFELTVFLDPVRNTNEVAFDGQSAIYVLRPLGAAHYDNLWDLSYGCSEMGTCGWWYLTAKGSGSWLYYIWQQQSSLYIRVASRFEVKLSTLHKGVGVIICQAREISSSPTELYINLLEAFHLNSEFDIE